MLGYVRKDIERLISAYEKADSDRIRISAELRECKALNETYRQQIVELERQIDNLKLRSAFTASSGDEDAKAKIDKMIKEIDKCISLMEG